MKEQGKKILVMFFSVAMFATCLAQTPAPPQTEGWVTLGEITVFGQTDPDGRKLPPKKVPIRFPENFLPTPDETTPHLKSESINLLLNEWGNIGRAYRGEGGWEEFKTLYREAQKRIQEGKANVWKCKAVIFRRTDVLYRREDGVLEPQRNYVSETDLNFCLETFARFKALVEAFTKGALEMQLTVSVEEEPITGYYERDQVWTLDPREAGYEYLRGRFNFGDFDCILYMFHPGTTRSFSFGGTAGRTNNATQAYVILSNGREFGKRIGHSEAMLHEWYHQIEDTYFHYGFGGREWSWLPWLHSASQNGYFTDEIGYSGWYSWLRDLMQYSVTEEMWKQLSNRKEPDWKNAIRQTRRWNGEEYEWSDVRDSPWQKLPYLTPEDIAKRLGASKIEIRAEESAVLFLPEGFDSRTPILKTIDWEDFTLNNELQFAREAIARMGNLQRDLFIIRWNASDFVLRNLQSENGEKPKVLGYISVDGRLMLVAQMKPLPDTLCETNLLALGNDRVKIFLKTKGEFLKGEPVTVSFHSNANDVRYVVTNWAGEVIPLEANGILSSSSLGVGTHYLKVQGIFSNGERIERPFVIRIVEPIRAKLQVVGTRRISASDFDLKLYLKNGSKSSRVKLSPVLPNGWTVEGLPQEISLEAYERKELLTKGKVSNEVRDGTATIRLDIVAEAYPGNVKAEELTLFRETSKTLKHDTFETGTEGWDVEREDSGGWRARSTEGGVQGKCLEIEDSGGVRWGRVTAFGSYRGGKRDAEGTGYETSSYPYLDFYFKTNSTQSLGLVVTLHNGKRYVIMLTGPYQEQWGESVQLARAKFIPNGQWQRIVYPLHEELTKVAGEGSHYVVDISLGDPRTFSSNQYRSSDRLQYYVDEFRITRDADLSANTTVNDPDSEINKEGDPNSPNAEDRARACANLSLNAPPERLVQIRKLIEDKSPLVRLNAAVAFTRVKDSDAIPMLIQRVKLDPDPGIAVQAVKALAFQDTPEAWNAIASFTRIHRFGEEPLSEAAFQLGRKGNPEYRKDISILLAARSWKARRDGAKALGNFQDEQSQIVLMAFLQEIDPMVRIAVAQGANPDVPLVAKRLEWGSVNDLSNVVRGYCYARLTRAKDPVIRSRGYAGLKEADPEIRRIICEEMGNDSQEHHVFYLQEMLKDPNPYVRAAAVNSLFKMPGERRFEEISVLSEEEYEQVLLPVLHAAKSGKIKLPNEMLSRLSEHRNAEVRAVAKEIKGT